MIKSIELHHRLVGTCLSYFCQSLPSCLAVVRYITWLVSDTMAMGLQPSFDGRSRLWCMSIVTAGIDVQTLNKQAQSWRVRLFALVIVFNFFVSLKKKKKNSKKAIINLHINVSQIVVFIWYFYYALCLCGRLIVYVYLLKGRRKRPFPLPRCLLSTLLSLLYLHRITPSAPVPGKQEG